MEGEYEDVKLNEEEELIEGDDKKGVNYWKLDVRYADDDGECEYEND